MKAASVSSWKMIEFVSVWKFNWCFERRTSGPLHLPARLSSLTRTNLQRIGWSRCRWLLCVFEQTFRILEWVCESLTGWGLASTEAYFYSDVLQEAEVAFFWSVSCPTYLPILGPNHPKRRLQGEYGGEWAHLHWGSPLCWWKRKRNMPGIIGIIG